MSLLRTLFPCLDNSLDAVIPSWEDEDAPWEILGGSISEQILDMTGPGESILIHPDAEIAENVTIEGPCYIGPGSEIRHGAFLRGGSWICGGSVVGNSSEIKNSILLPGSNAPHFNYVGDSIIGANSNLGAGVKLSNVRNDRGLISVVLLDGAKLKTNLRKFGALIGDGSQIGCNAVTNPGSLIAPHSMIKPNETITGRFGFMS